MTSHDLFQLANRLQIRLPFFNFRLNPQRGCNWRNRRN